MTRSTGNPVLDAVIAQGRVIPATNPGLIPPTPPRDDQDGEINLSEQLIHDREAERSYHETHACGTALGLPVEAPG